MTDTELVEQAYNAITEWMQDPTMKQAALIGRLIELYEQSGRGFIDAYELREDDYDDGREAPTRPRLTVIEGGGA